MSNIRYDSSWVDLSLREIICRSVALIGQPSEKQSGAPTKAAKEAARKTAATGRRRRNQLT